MFDPLDRFLRSCLQVLPRYSRYASGPGQAKVSRVRSRDADDITAPPVYQYLRIDLTFRDAVDTWLDIVR